ncbi:S-layer homology domain-containing protein [Paenibacillus sp. strain BS8-2]
MRRVDKLLKVSISLLLVCSFFNGIVGANMAFGALSDQPSNEGTVEPYEYADLTEAVAAGWNFGNETAAAPWSIVDEEGTNDTKALYNSNASAAYSPAYNNSSVSWNTWTDYAAEVNVRVPAWADNTMERVGIIIRGDMNGKSSYLLAYDHKGGNGNQALSIQKRDSNGYGTALKTVSGANVPDLAPDTYFNLKLAATGSQPVVLRGYLNDVELLTVVDDSDTPYTSGRPAIMTNKQNAYFDDLFIQAVTVNQAPSWASGALTSEQHMDHLRLSWSGAIDDQGVSGYKVYQDGQLLQTVTESTYALYDLQEDQSYTFKVEAVDAEQSESSDGPSLTVTYGQHIQLAAPEQVRLNARTDTAALLTWSPSEDEISGYHIYHNGVLIDDVDAATTRFTLTGLTANAEQTIAVTAYDPYGHESEPGSVVFVNHVSQQHEEGWESLHMGAGGQIQGLALDPNRPGRIYLQSDMEGNYRSDDYGRSWLYIGADLNNGLSLTAAVEPGDADRVYEGGIMGMNISDDAGLSWREVPELRAVSIASIVIDPHNTNNIYAATGWHNKTASQLSTFSQPAQSMTGARVVYMSKDRGASWTTVPYEQQSGNKHVYSLVINPADGDELYLGGDAGVYRSIDAGQSWSKVAPPADSVAYSGMSQGVAVSPDGQYIYATYKTADEVKTNGSITTPLTYSVFVARTDSLEWTKLDEGLTFAVSETTDIGGSVTYSAAGMDFWKPVMDPRSTATQHKLIIGTLNKASAVYEGTFEIDQDGHATGSWKKIYHLDGIVNAEDSNQAWQYDMGLATFWGAGPLSRHYTYTPASWPDREVLLAERQTVYGGDPDSPYTSWELISSKQAYTYTVGNESFTSYTSRGVQSTFNWNMDTYGNYVVQAQADNAWLESWDYGYSWTQPAEDNRKANADSVRIIPLEEPIVLVGAALGAVTNRNNSTMYGKRLGDLTPNNERWEQLSGQTRDELGNTITLATVPYKRINSIAYDPLQPKRVVLGTDDGLYMTEDIETFMDTLDVSQYDFTPEAPFVEINDSQVDQTSVRYVEFDPYNSNVLYTMAGSKGIFKGEYANDSWTWTRVFDKGGSGGDLRFDMSVWGYQGATYMLVSHLDTLYLSTDGGATWTEVMNDKQIIASKSNIWWDTSIMTLDLGTVAGYEDYLFVSSGTKDSKKGYAAFIGKLQQDGTVIWREWTGTPGEEGYLEYPHGRAASFHEVDDKVYVYIATTGAGLWRKEVIGQAVRSPQPEVPFTIVRVSPRGSAEWVDVNDTIVISANKAIAHVDINSIQIQGPDGNVPFAYSIAGKQVTMTPSRPLTGEARYIVHLDAGSITDSNDKGLTYKLSFAFTTKKAPATEGGGSSGLIVPPAQPPLVVEVGADGSMTLRVQTTINKNQVAAAKLSAEDWGKVLQQAQSNGNQQMTIQLPPSEGAEGYALELPVAFFHSDIRVELATAVGTLRLPDHLVDSQSIQESDSITISIQANETNGKPAITLQWTTSELAELGPLLRGVPVAMQYQPTGTELANPDWIVVQRIDSDGVRSPVPSGYYDPEAGVIRFISDGSGTYVVSYVRKSFEDISGVAWAEHAIEVLAARGVTNGVSSQEFHPHAPVTRADFMVMLVRALGLKAPVDHSFTDVAEDAYYYEALGIAKALGIAQGGVQADYRPNETITRQDMMVLVDRALRLAADRPPVTGSDELDRFTDADNVADYAVSSVAALVQAGIVQGSGQQLNPLHTATRAEVAVLIYKLIRSL